MYKYMKMSFIFLLVFIFALSPMAGLDKTGMAKGIRLTASDSSYCLRPEIVIQPQTAISADLDNESFVQGKAFMQRLRFSFKGFVLDPSLTFGIQIDGTKDDVLYDAYIKWMFAPRTSLIAGQKKISGALARLMSFRNLNFIDYSYAENMFGLNRDFGLELQNEWNAGNFYAREFFTLSGGEGRNRKTEEGGYCYTGRVELLPLGKFKSKGDRSQMDLARETSPKLLVGGGASYNDDAHRSRATCGADLFETVDITTFMADVLFKYAGFACYGEYYKREAPEFLTANADNSETQYVYTGQAGSAQISYMPVDDICIAFRYSYVEPADEILEFVGQRTDYSLGFSKFLYKNRVKIQADASYIEEEKPGAGLGKRLEIRLNMILSI